MGNHDINERNLLGLSAYTAQILDEQQYENDYSDNVCLCIKEGIIQIHNVIIA